MAAQKELSFTLFNGVVNNGGILKRDKRFYSLFFQFREIKEFKKSYAEVYVDAFNGFFLPCIVFFRKTKSEVIVCYLLPVRK